jgi:hypothetical protein
LFFAHILTQPNETIRKAKENLQQAYLANTISKNCRYWSGKPGLLLRRTIVFEKILQILKLLLYIVGSCQFGSSCHYKHINPDGTIGVDTTRSYVDENGGLLRMRVKV